MLEIQTSSSVNSTKVAAGIAGAVLLSGGATTWTPPTPLLQDYLKANHHKELIVRFSEGRSGDLQWRPAERNVIKADIVEPSLMINTVIGALGLGMTDLEKVLKVKRATVYNWRKGGDVRGEDSIMRLRKVYEIAKDIAVFNDRPFGKRAKTHQIEGKSYLDLLSEEHFDTKAIIAIAKVLSNQENARLKAKNEVNLKTNDIDNISGGWQRV